MHVCGKDAFSGKGKKGCAWTALFAPCIQRHIVAEDEMTNPSIKLIKEFFLPLKTCRSEHESLSSPPELLSIDPNTAVDSFDEERRERRSEMKLNSFTYFLFTNENRDKVSLNGNENEARPDGRLR